MDFDFGKYATGKCIGWHKLSEKEYTEALKKSIKLKKLTIFLFFN